MLRRMDFKRHRGLIPMWVAIIIDTTIRLWHVGDCSYAWEDAGIDRQQFGSFDFQLSELVKPTKRCATEK
jgi:hypothetical protein